MLLLVLLLGLIWSICFIQLGIEIERIRKIMEKILEKAVKQND